MMLVLAMRMSSPAERNGDVFGERGYVLVAYGVAHAGEDAEGEVDAVRSGGEGEEVGGHARADGEAAGAGDEGDEGGVEEVVEW